MTMTYDFSLFKTKLKAVEDWLAKEFTSLRTGRASQALLDSVLVESYGSRVPINQLATVGTEDPRTLRIAPWDASQGKEIEKAIIAANLGISVVTDDKGLRVVFPELTTERRESLMKVARAKLEEAKVSIRKERDTVWQNIQEKEKDGGMSEDDKFRFKNEMEKLTQDGVKKLEDLVERKEKEIIS